MLFHEDRCATRAREGLTQGGAEPVGNSVEEFKVAIAETIRWRRVEQAPGIKSAS